MNAVVSMPRSMHQRIWQDLLPAQMQVEESGFAFAGVNRTVHGLTLECQEWYHAQPGDYAVQLDYHIELKDEMRPKLIKQAHESETAIVEVHSHLGNGEVGFSPSDLSGFEEFVPHIRWRLGGRPYVAIVINRTGFDALAWIDETNTPTSLAAVEIPKLLFWRQRFQPNNQTIAKLRRNT